MEKYISLAQVEQLIDDDINHIGQLEKEAFEAGYIRDAQEYSIQRGALYRIQKKLSSLPTEESGWIAIDNQEFEPKEMIKHLIWYHEGIGIAAMDSGIWYDDFLNTPFGITHFMPLPKPPLQ